MLLPKRLTIVQMKCRTASDGFVDAMTGTGAVDELRHKGLRGF